MKRQNKVAVVKVSIDSTGSGMCIRNGIGRTHPHQKKVSYKPASFFVWIFLSLCSPSPIFFFFFNAAKLETVRIFCFVFFLLSTLHLSTHGLLYFLGYLNLGTLGASWWSILHTYLCFACALWLSFSSSLFLLLPSLLSVLLWSCERKPHKLICNEIYWVVQIKLEENQTVQNYCDTDCVQMFVAKRSSQPSVDWIDFILYFLAVIWLVLLSQGFYLYIKTWKSVSEIKEPTRWAQRSANSLFSLDRTAYRCQK